MSAELIRLRGDRDLHREIRRNGYDFAYCPLCDCAKGGDHEEPNARTEACQDDKCRCHAEEAE